MPRPWHRFFCKSLRWHHTLRGARARTGHFLLWQHSHIEESERAEYGPVEAPEEVNVAADGQATVAAAGPHAPFLRIPLGLPLIALTLRREAIVGDVSKAMRREEERRALRDWAECVNQGAVAREIEALFRPALLMSWLRRVTPSRRVAGLWSELRDAPCPRPLDLSKVAWSMRNAFCGSMTSHVKYSVELRRRVGAVRIPSLGESQLSKIYTKTSGLRGIGLPAWRRAESVRRERCRILDACHCGWGRGCLRHVIFSCGAGGLPEMRAQMWAALERILMEFREGANLPVPVHSPQVLPGWWVGAFPLLASGPFFLPTISEAELCLSSGERLGPRLEGPAELCARGTIPIDLLKSLLPHLWEEGSGGARFDKKAHECAKELTCTFLIFALRMRQEQAIRYDAAFPPLEVEKEGGEAEE